MSTTTHDIASPTSAPRDTALHDVTTRIYRGRTVDELIPKIQTELGADAIVVRHHKGLTGGIGGFFQRPFVEIEAKPGTPRIDRYDDEDAEPALPDALEQPSIEQPPAANATGLLAALAPGEAGPMSPHDDLNRIAGGAGHSVEEFRELTPASLLERPPARQRLARADPGAGQRPLRRRARRGRGGCPAGRARAPRAACCHGLGARGQAG